MSAGYQIQELVSNGTVEQPIEVQRLKYHVKLYMIFADNMPDPNYFPTLDELYRRSQKSATTISSGSKNAEKLIKKQQVLNHIISTLKIEIFSPKTTLSGLDNAVDFETTLHQEVWQQELMVKYGNTVSLMDATYKTIVL